MIGDFMEVPFRPKVHSVPGPFGRPIVRRVVDIETITEETALPTEAIRRRTEVAMQILPIAGINQPKDSADPNAI